MQFLNQRSQETQWQRYKQLELIPESVSYPQSFTFGLSWAWRKFIELLIAEVAAEDRMEEYLDRCWKLNETDVTPRPLNKLWILMD